MQTLYFTIKEWNRFDWNKQEILTSRYNVILSDYKTKKQRILEILDKINFKNFDKGLLIFNTSVSRFGDTMDKLTGEFSSDVKKSNESAKSHEQKNKENLEKIWGKHETVE